MDELDSPYATALLSLVLMLSFNIIWNNEIAKSFKTHFIRRARASVSAIIYELGNKSKNYYHMSDNSFWKLHSILKEKIESKEEVSSRHSRKKCKKRYIPNRIICSTIRLSIALRIFARESPLDVALVHGVSLTKVNYSIWKVIDAIHQILLFNINYPMLHTEQIKIANNFKNISSADFYNCGGCIDGLLV